MSGNWDEICPATRGDGSCVCSPESRAARNAAQWPDLPAQPPAQVWVAETWNAHGYDQMVLGVYTSREAAFQALKERPNMTVYTDENGHVKARPCREPSFSDQVIAYLPVKWGRAFPAVVQT